MILGIENRTENWKTALTFARMYPENLASLANYLLKSYCEFDDCNLTNLQPGQVQLELFWKGVRDHVYKTKEETPDLTDEFVQHYGCLFPDLHHSIKCFRTPEGWKFRKLDADNYVVPNEAKVAKRLYDNLFNTEIDIVLESPNHLFIGEAKHEMSFGTDSGDILVHQLIRQYVMGKILLKHLNRNKAVVPFVVWDKDDTKRREVQIQFMVCQGWLKKGNILTWSGVEKLSGIHCSDEDISRG